MTMQSMRAICCVICIVTASPLAALETGKPADIDPSSDYYRMGMDADKAGNQLAAASMLRYAYYKSPTADNFFWYCEKLSKGRYYNELITEYSNAPDTARYSSNYGGIAARLTAEALRNRGELDRGAAVLIEAYLKKTKDHILIGSMLVNENMLDTGYSRAFMRSASYRQVLTLMCESLASAGSRKEITAAKDLYFFLMAAACEQAVAGNNAQARKLIDEAGDIVSRFGAMDAVCNQANYDAMKRAVYAYKKGGETSSYHFKWLCLYTNEINADSAVGTKIQVINSQNFIKAKMEDAAFNLAAATVFYYYISGGRIHMDFDHRQYNAVATGLSAVGRFSRADMRTLSPFPSQLMQDRDGCIDGIMFFYPAFPGTAYLGGLNNYPIVPYLLNSQGQVFMLNMISGAAANVYIHEIFHGFESAYKVSGAHMFSQENSTKWPQWYKQITAKNGTTAEWYYYERIFADTIAAQDGIRFPARNSPPYSRSVIDNALKLYTRIGAELCAQTDTALFNAEILAKKDPVAAENAYKKILERAPDHPDALFRTGFFYHWTVKNRGEAQRYYDRYLELYNGFPATFTAALYSCTWYLNSGNAQKVLEITDRALPCMTASYDIYHLKLNRVHALLRLKRTGEAAAILAAGAADKDNPIRDQYLKESAQIQK